MSGLTKINPNDLKVGDVVGYCVDVSYGWCSKFRYPVVTKKVVLRITPKRTKFVLSGDIELNIREASELVIFNEEAERQSSIAKTFKDLQSITYKIDEAKRNNTALIERKISDEELIQYHDLMKSFYDKYLGGN